MLHKYVLSSVILLLTVSLFAQTHMEDTSSSKFFNSQYIADSGCPTIDSILQFAFYKKTTAQYKYGAAGPDFFDCSGFVYYCFGYFNISLPRSSGDMYLVGQTITKENLQPGDLVFFSRGNASIGHVGIVVKPHLDADNNFSFIHSSTYKTNVRVDYSTSPGYVSRFVGAKRVISCDEEHKRIILPSDYIPDTIPTHPIFPSASTTPTDSSTAQNGITQTDSTSVQPSKPAPVKTGPTTPSKKYYTVKRGDTLSSIARKFHTSVDKLKKLNKLHSDLIREGQRLIVAQY